ncbi:MAG TPA: methyl-accepting chemotaxis protein [Gemmatimonadales bacterium]|nr:methyl-accepting chemotaxis protein [Gemmatimonadales bacterium]
MKLLGSLRRRLMAGLVLLGLLFLAIVVAGIGSLRAANRTIAQELVLVAASSDLGTDLVGSVADQVRTGESYLNNPSPELAAEFLRLGDSTHAYRRRFRVLPGLTAEDQSALNRVEASQAQMEVAYSEAHALRDLGRVDSALARARTARAPAEALIADVRALTGRQQSRVSQQIASLRQRARQREALVGLLVVTAVVVGITTALLTVRSIESPLQQLSDAARRFGEGDLRPSDPGDMPDELATLSRAMGQMGARLRSVIDNVIREARNIGLSAGDLSAMSEQLAAGSSEISRAITGVTRNAELQVQEVRAADQVIAGWRETAARDATVAERVVSSGDQVRLLAEHQRDDLASAAGSLEGLRRAAQDAGLRTRDLTRHTDSVSELLDLARQLGAQSEVLAINASIEAARNGSGEGMEAIAGEARRLADTSRGTAERVTASTESLGESLAGLSRAIQTIGAEAVAVSTTSQRTRIALEEIVRTVEALREQAAHVVSSAAESRSIAGKLADLRVRLEADARETVVASEAVTGAAGDQSSATGEIANSAARLLESSERLAALVADFRV